jgi:repressor LexA
MEKKQANTISERIRQLLENRSISAYRLCKDLEIDDSTYSRSSRTANTWKTAHLIKIADYFKVSLDWLLKGENFAKEVQRELKEVNQKVKQVPILGIAECGKPAATWHETSSKIVELTEAAHLHSPFILIAKGDSMRPYINPGDRLLCADMPERIKNGTAVVVSFYSPPDTYEANAKLIKFERDGMVTLYSVNTQYAPTLHKDSEIQKIFKLVRIIRDVK